MSHNSTSWVLVFPLAAAVFLSSVSFVLSLAILFIFKIKNLVVLLIFHAIWPFSISFIMILSLWLSFFDCCWVQYAFQMIDFFVTITSSVCVCMCTHKRVSMCTYTQYLGQLENNSQEFLLSFSFVQCPKDQLHITRLRSNHLYLLWHLACPNTAFPLVFET